MKSTAFDYDAALARARVAAGAFAVDNAFRSLALLGRLHPEARATWRKLEVIRDVPYLPTGLAAHRLDVYRPRGARGPLPIVFYTHGGGFRILSKDTHWVMGLAFAREGFVVFNVDYRLAPAHRYPAAIADACAALAWVARNAERYGGDPSRIVLAGESAGANLTAALAIATAYERPEPFARELFAQDVRPLAALPACGILQVTDHERHARRRPMPSWLLDRLREPADAYLGDLVPQGPGGFDLADPLVVLERGEAPARPLPPFFAGVGTRDPLLDDTRRLKRALDRLEVPCKVAYYPGELHAFNALLWRPSARAFWRESFEFVAQYGATPEPPTAR